MESRMNLKENKYWIEKGYLDRKIGDALPLLPDPIPYSEPPFPPSEQPALPKLPVEWPPQKPLVFRALRHGCYLIRYTPTSPGSLIFWHYDGTMRVQRDGFNTIASGDLYFHSIWSWTWKMSSTEPDPASGIPIFPRNRYRYYIRVTQILESWTLLNSFTLGFELHRFDHSSQTWTNEGAFTAQMSWTTAPPGYPSTSDYLTGEVKNSSGAVVGNLTMGWVSPHLRRAVVEIDRVSASEAPLNNGAGVDWQDIFDEVGWQVNVIESDTNVTEPSGESWSKSECHANMLTWRDSANLDTQWRYHLLCVRRLDVTSRGIMYDCYGTDSNNVPREGAALASHWVFPNANPWGKCKGMRFGAATGPYFRTAVHEIGHAILLYHPWGSAGNHLMQVTPNIAYNAVPPEEFPDNIGWSFSPEDQKLLRHLPDIAVRPGGVPFGTSHSSIPISPNDMIADAEGLELEVSPLLETVPIGAPVRVNMTLKNTTNEPLPAPESLSMKTGYVKGKVIDPSGAVRTYWPIIRYLDEVELQKLEPGQSISHSLTLLRGREGALFPSPGVHRVIVEVTWNVDGYAVGLTGETSIMVTPPIDEDHAKTALKILAEPDALLTLAINGDHLTDGIAAIQAGISHSALRPHFAFIEAKRVGRRFGKRKADLKATAKILDETTVMSPAEIKRAAEFVQSAAKEAPDKVVKQIAELLQDKASTVKADDETMKMVKSI